MIVCGDCLDIMAMMEEDSVDSIVTDPPYGLGFMGKDWDHGVPGMRFWEACLRVAKPGAHLLAFGGTRTFHRLAVAVEDAGWEIRDTIGWLYGSGFPKSHNVGKAIDKAAGAEREVIQERTLNNNRFATSGTGKEQEQYRKFDNNANITAPATEAAKTWDGWGTALKPAWEPVIVARKPFKNTVAGNVLEWGTGAINIDGCRVGHDEPIKEMKAQAGGNKVYQQSGRYEATTELKPNGRWPANVIHDGSDEVLAVFPETGKSSGGGGATKYGSQNRNNDNTIDYGKTIGLGDNGSAARFFYCAKASKRERVEDNRHPTVKPLALMRYLCRLVTPPNGVVFDPFMGSGSTGVAAIQEGFEFIGCDTEEEYCQIAKRRIDKAIEEGVQLGLEI